MSTDFTSGKNKEITAESTYLMLSNKLDKLFKNENIDINRDFLFEEYGKENLFNITLNDKSKRWDLLTRYDQSNNYTSNKFDDIIILSNANDKSMFLNVDYETIELRRNEIVSICSSFFELGLSNNFSDKITGFFPHLDRPNEIIDILCTSGSIQCFEFGFSEVYALITYEDSCGMKFKQPVPSFNGYILNEKTNKIENDQFELNTLNDDAPENSSFKWTIISNKNSIAIKDNIDYEKTIKLSTLSSAIHDYIMISLNYHETFTN